MKHYDWLRIKENKRIDTKDLQGNGNGFLIDILNRNDEIFSGREEETFQQFYMTTVLRGSFKGLHVHPYKLDTIFVPMGRICLAVYTEPVSLEQSANFVPDPNKYEFIEMGEGCYKTVSYPSKYPHGFWGIAEESIIINYRSPTWTRDDTYQFDIDDKTLMQFLIARYII